MNKNTDMLSVAASLAMAWAVAVAQAQVNTGPQMGPTGPGDSKILTVPIGPSTPGQKTKQPAANLPAQPEDSMRDPFWPVDYVPPKAQVDAGPSAPMAEETPDAPTRNWEQAQRGLSINGIIKSGASYLASINNKILGANDTVSIYYDSQKYVWKITSITAKKVLFQPDEAASNQPDEQPQ